MRRYLIIIGVLLAVGSMIFAQSGAVAPQKSSNEKKLIYLKSDKTFPIQVADSSAVCFVGNFAAEHNGTIITCDSAVRYSDRQFECFGHVLINKKTTYIYGERAEYDGNTNTAHVYSDLIKVIDGDATFYTYNFSFNTKSNIGTFSGGGMLINRDNRMEAQSGYYYTDTKNLVCVGNVEMRNDEYEMTGDSVIYNIATDHAEYFENTNIWNKDGDYLYGDRGEYSKPDTLYTVTLNGYILTEKQEVWCDSLKYFRGRENVIMRRDIQIDDTEHKTLAFGDYGEYWKFPGNAFLTRRPSMISYDKEQGDSLFMRADSMFLYTRNINDDIAAAAAAVADSLAKSDSTNAVAGQTPVPREMLSSDSLVATDIVGRDSIPSAAAPIEDGAAMQGDSIAKANGADSLAMDSVKTDKELTPEELAKIKAEQKKAKAIAKKAKLDEIAQARQAKVTARLDEQKEREDMRLAKLKLKAESKLRARQARAARKGKIIAVDSTELAAIDSLIVKNRMSPDSLALDSLAIDSLQRDSMFLDSLAMIRQADSLDSLAIKRDTIYRLVKAYRNVKAYRSDFQCVCDSLTAISTDSTIHLYIEPVLWNESSQITSEVMDIFTKNQQIARAEFVGKPMMISEIDTTHYNQVTGKEMTAFFANNQIYRNDVDGNAQTLYYTQDGDGGEVTGFMVLDSGSITFFIEKKQLTTIVYRTNPVGRLYPMDKIPPDQSLYLKEFKWEGKRRPTQAEVFDRIVRPSQREVRQGLPKPIFPISQSISEYKNNIVMQRLWLDRTDVLSPEVVDWVRSLGL